jgi:phosphohistidine phosphatase
MPPPPKRLHLLRHAKSSWDDPGLTDHDRPLAPRGVRAATGIGRRLRETGVAPELILCSSARRARDTLALLELAGAVSIEPALYGASSRALLERVRRVREELPSLMLIGHNPDMQSLATLLAAESPLRLELAMKFPTGALATLEHTGAWSDLSWGCCELTEFMRPRDLE